MAVTLEALAPGRVLVTPYLEPGGDPQEPGQWRLDPVPGCWEVVAVPYRPTGSPPPRWRAGERVRVEEWVELGPSVCLASHAGREVYAVREEELAAWEWHERHERHERRAR